MAVQTVDFLEIEFLPVHRNQFYDCLCYIFPFGCGGTVSTAEEEDDLRD